MWQTPYLGNRQLIFSKRSLNISMNMNGLLKHLRLPVILIASTFCSCVTEDDTEGYSKVTVGDKLPLFSVEMNSGRTISTDSLRGKTSMIVFFNTDCSDCRKELPVVNEVAELMRDRVETVCISRSQGADEIASYWKENGFTLPYSAQTDRCVYDIFATSGIPRIYITDKNLTVTHTFSDYPLPAAEELIRCLTSE